MRGNTYESVTGFFAPTDTYLSLLQKDCTDVKVRDEVHKDARLKAEMGGEVSWQSCFRSSTIEESRFDDSQCGEDVAEVGGVARDDALESLGEGGDQDVSHGTPRHLELSASELELMPEAMCKQ